MKCSKCGCEFNEGVFCPQCGNKITQSTETESNVIQNNNQTTGTTVFSNNTATSNTQPQKKKHSLLSIIIVIIIVVVIFKACFGGSDAEEDSSMTPSETSKIINTEQPSASKVADNTSSEDVVAYANYSPQEVVDKYQKALYAHETETACNLCTENEKERTTQRITESKKSLDDNVKAALDEFANTTEAIFYDHGVDMSGSFVRNDKDIKEACEKYAYAFGTVAFQYDYPNETRYTTESSAEVDVHTVALDIESFEDEDTLLYEIMGELENNLWEKYSGNSNIVTDAIAKKVVKEIWLNHLSTMTKHLLDNKYEYSDIIEESYMTFYLTKTDNRWLINDIKKNDTASSSQTFAMEEKQREDALLLIGQDIEYIASTLGLSSEDASEGKCFSNNSIFVEANEWTDYTYINTIMLTDDSYHAAGAYVGMATDASIKAIESYGIKQDLLSQSWSEDKAFLEGTVFYNESISITVLYENDKVSRIFIEQF